MKLPDSVKTGVRPLGIVDTGAIMGAAGAVQRASETVNEVAYKIYESIETDKATNYLADSFVQLNDARARAETEPDATKRGDVYRADIDAINEQADMDLEGYALKIWKERFNTKADQSHGDLVIRSAIKANTQQREMTKNEALQNAYDGNAAIARGQIAEATMYTDDEKSLIYQEIDRQAELGLVEKAAYSNNPELIQMELDRINSFNYDGHLRGNQRIQAVRFLQNQWDNATKTQRAAEQRASEYAYSELIVGVGQGKVGLMDIEKAWEDRTIKTGTQRASLINAYYDHQNKKQAGLDAENLVLYALNEGEPLDPKNKDHVKAVNYYADNMSEPTWEKLLDLTARTNIAPERLMMEVRRLPFAGKPNKVMQMANLFERMQEVAPQSIVNIPPEYEAFYTTVSMLNRGGVDLEEAIKTSRHNAFELTPEQKKGFADAYEQQGPVLERVDDWIDKRFDTGLSWQPDATQAQITSYRAVESHFFTLTGGNMEAATAATQRYMNRIWSNSGISGENKMMAYAPERMTNLPTDYLREELIKFGKEHGQQDVFIVPDTQTAREPGVKSYAVWYKDEFGGPHVLEDATMKPVRWTPDVSNYHAQKLIKAQAERERMLEDMGDEMSVLFDNEP